MAVRRITRTPESVTAAGAAQTRLETMAAEAAGDPGVSRRRFMRMLAAGTAAALAAPRMSIAAAETKKPATGGVTPSGSAATQTHRVTRVRTGEAGTRTALPEEIEKQKKYLADSLKAIREFSLPPGSPPSFVFRPLKPRRARRNG